MIKYQKVGGVNVSDGTDLPRIQVTEEGRAMGAIPGWSLFADPDYASVSGNWVRNRALPSTVSIERTGTVNVGEFPSGQSALLSTDEAPFNTLCPTVIDAERCSGFAVVQLTGVGGGSRVRLIRADPEQGDGYGVHFAVSTGGGLIEFMTNTAQATQSSLLTGELGGSLFEREEPVLLGFTFSVERGMGLFQNGEEIARDSSLNQPFEVGTEETNVVLYQNCRGFMGMFGLLKTDLSAPENTGHRRAIEKFLMTKYGISGAS